MLSKTVLSLALLAGTVLSLRADEPTYYKIPNKWLSGQGLVEDQGGQVVYGPMTGDNALWTTIDTGTGFVQIQNKATGDFLAIQDGAVQPVAAKSGDGDGALWAVTPIFQQCVSLKNKVSGNYLNVQHKAGHPECDSPAAPDEKNRWAALWSLAYVSGPTPQPLYQPNTVYVTAPAYCSDVKGATPLALRAPGLKTVEVKCWKQGDGYGADATVGAVTLDDKGQGSIVFPADDFPHGPLIVRLTGTNGTNTDTCYLQLYNRGGVSWNEGIPAQAPAAAQGMELAYSDNFDKPLSISKTGENATYAAHKPGGGDFGKLHFSDFESPENPFAQVDTYLRIRADQNKGTAGLLSSLKMDGTGFTAKVPCYFECRLMAQNATGSWPAFWVMTQGTYQGLKEPADELDVIEGYGGEGPGNPNQKGYWTTTHYWNQGDEGKAQPGVYKQIPMETIGGKSSWYTTFHTYGVLISETDTVYYCDNIEVARHPTGKLSKEQPFFFFINLAVPGHGWKMDLSRYGGAIDMYVDWVRAYQGK